MSSTEIIERYLDELRSRELLMKLSWEEWRAIQPPYTDDKFTTAETWIRFQRNGYDWDMHGTLFTPEKEADPQRGFVFFHGGEIIACGHSTGGPMAAHLTRCSKKTKVIRLGGFGSGGHDRWRKEWRKK